MQSIKGKKESLLRLLGMVLLIITTLLSVVFAFFILNLQLYIMFLTIFFCWFILIILLKLEKDFFVNNKNKFFVVLIILLIVMVFVGNILSPLSTNAILFSSVSIAEILLLISWHFSLSIFKKEKLIFLVCGIAYCVITLIFSLGSMILQIGLLLGLGPLILAIVGISLILIAERLMKKKGLLNYV